MSLSQVFDLGIIGTGIAGTFAAWKIASSQRNLKTLLIESGRPSRKRRTQMQGFLGLLPNSNGQLYLNDLNQVQNITSEKNCKDAFKWFQNQTNNILNQQIIKDISLNSSLEKKVKKAGFNINLNNYIQLIPQEIHRLSKSISEEITKKNNIFPLFDVEATKIVREKNHFLILTDREEYRCKKLLLSVGRSGWRWAAEIYEQFGIITNNDYSQFGVRVEIADTSMKELNHSSCTLIRDNLEIGPFSWHGTIIPEDHFDMAISSFRSNENRWKTDKLSFNISKKIHYPNSGIQQTNRLGQLTFILTNERIAKEKITTLLAGKSKLSIMPEYKWVASILEELNDILPDLNKKGYIHFPTIFPMAPQIKVNSDFSTEVPGFYVAGESAGVSGILSAILSGIVVGSKIK